MGFIFENMEKMDIQAERENTRLARQELTKARKDAAEAQRNAAEAQRNAAEAQRNASETQKNAQRTLIETCMELGASKEFTHKQLCNKLSLSAAEAEKSMQKYWKQ